MIHVSILLSDIVIDLTKRTKRRIVDIEILSFDEKLLGYEQSFRTVFNIFSII